MTIPDVTLHNGVAMPQLGYGMWQVEDGAAVHAAVAAGYRHLDTAAVYGNEAMAGRAIAQSGVSRDAFFVTTKLWNSEHGYDATLRAFDASRTRLGVDVVDLYLVHWPAPARDLYVDTWRAFERLYADGAVRAIGVSNFERDHLQRLLDEGEVAPMVNQVELHPLFAQAPLRAFHAAHGIVTEDWSPLARGGRLLANPVVVALAQRLGRTPAQVVLRWHLQLGSVVIPRSQNPQRIAENLDVFDFVLDDAAVAQLDALDAGKRTGPDPNVFG